MDVRLYISVPSNRGWQGNFGSSLASLVSRLAAEGIKGHVLESQCLRHLAQSSCLSIARQYFVDEMIEGGFTHWLSLDDDMEFPEDIVDRLIAHDRDVVAVNARLKNQTVDGSLCGMDGKRLDSTGKTGVEEIKWMGGAIFLAKVDAFRNILKPHFQVLWNSKKQAYISEDVYFAALLRANGVKLWCDHDVSQSIGHIGNYGYRWEAVPTSFPVSDPLMRKHDLEVINGGKMVA